MDCGPLQRLKGGAEDRQVEARSVEGDPKPAARKAPGKILEVSASNEDAKPAGIEDADHRRPLHRDAFRFHVKEGCFLREVGIQAPRSEERRVGKGGG